MSDGERLPWEGLSQLVFGIQDALFKYTDLGNMVLFTIMLSRPATMGV